MNTITAEFPSFVGGERTNERCAVILAGGEGSRLRNLTRSITGDDRPKQFCPIVGGRSLIDATRRRTAILIPRENTYFSLAAKHESYFRLPLWDVPASCRVVQPENKGTAPAILYSLMRIAAEKPNAIVAFFPSDHFFTEEESFMEQVDSAFQAAALNPDSVILLGIQPDTSETSYGWIEPAKSLFGSETRSFSRVERFWEKPSARVAERLFTTGCLWNSFVMVGRVDAFLAMYREYLPEMFRMFALSSHLFGTEREAPIVRSIYAWLNETNFSSEVLEKATGRLMVMRVADVGWSDLGEPQRVLGTLSGLGLNPVWARLVA